MTDFSLPAIIHRVPKSHWVNASKPHLVFSSGDRVRKIRKAHQILVAPLGEYLEERGGEAVTSLHSI
jgi:hypothetical protein